MEPIDPVLHAFAQARATRVGEGTGLGGRQRPVWLSPEGVAFCGCSGWIRSPRRPRTCTHIHSLVEEGLLPIALEMSEDDVRAEAKFMRQKEPSAETVIAALRESRSGKKFPETKAALDAVIDQDQKPKMSRARVHEVLRRSAPHANALNAEIHKSFAPDASTKGLRLGAQSGSILDHSPTQEQLAKVAETLKAQQIIMQRTPCEIAGLEKWASMHTGEILGVACWSRKAWADRMHGLVVMCRAGNADPVQACTVHNRLVNAFAEQGLEVQAMGDHQTFLVRRI